jgi:hypothetical protein
MNIRAEELTNATIRDDGSVREAGPNGEPIEVFVVETAKHRFWFEIDVRYADNGDDRWVTIRNFGLRGKLSAGGTSPWALHSFNAAGANAARSLVEAFFLGSPDGAVLPYVPYAGARGRCLGVNFPRDWIEVL